MRKILDHMKWFDPVARFILLAWAVIWLVVTYWKNPVLSGLSLSILVFLILLDIGRLRSRFVPNHFTAFSVLSIVLCALFLAAKRADIIQIYYFFLLDELLDKQKGKIPKALIVIHFIGFMGAECYVLYGTGHEIFQKDFSDIFILLACYALILLILIVAHYRRWEREHLKELNAKLIEYSFQEREYLFAKERSQISQELHDSLGHSLMAVLMNVRYLKAIQDKSQDEKDKQLNEIEDLVKECVSNLRTSVYNLRELDETVNLREEIERIIQNFDQMGLIKIRLNYDDQIDEAPNAIKVILHKTIREGITNSIRHGNASSVQISIRRKENHIELVIQDNGSGCAEIHKSFGLNGIVDRVKEVGGDVWFISAKDDGFTIRALLPGGNET